ncbi:hypothetical protein KH400_05370 [Desertibacillus haloalkaliphilus]|nr:hypothetical protein [Desertibacillus haloalkaliphilus]
MATFLQPLLKKAKEVIGDTAHAVKGTFDGILDRNALTIAEITELIRHHPDTRKKKRNLLNITYQFYRLRAGDYLFYMETRGEENEKVLFLSIQTPKQIVFTYRSYDDQYSINDTIDEDHLLEHAIKDEAN